ncbi:MAG: VOC family protein [Candidatus Hydrogenedentes bacterium]|nr:VOC family protein [Candidatus Hydrogenedentota bacterium]
MFRSDHFAFRVSDLDASIAFYTEKLGLPFMFKKVDPEMREAFAYLELEGGNLELLQLLDAQGNPVPMEQRDIEPPYAPHLALGTDDLGGLLAKAKEAGVPVVDGPFDTPGLVKWVYLSDPDNNVIEFVQWVKRD